MDSTKQRHVYRLVKIEHGIEAVPLTSLKYDEYADAWNFCVLMFYVHERISAFLIYSTRGTGIFLRRDNVAVMNAIRKRHKKTKKV